MKSCESLCSEFPNSVPKILKHFYNLKSVKISFKSIKLLPKHVVTSKLLPLLTKKWVVLTYSFILSTVNNEKKRYNSFWTKFESFGHSVAAAFWSAQHPHQQVVQHEHAGCYTVGKFATLCSEKSCENHIMMRLWISNYRTQATITRSWLETTPEY